MLDFQIHHYTISESTNTDAIKLAEQGYPEGTVVIADEQTSGFGRRGRSWCSPRGNLYFSIILRNYLEIAPISFISSLSVGSTLKKILCKDVISYKWPNDVLVEDKKISGVLMQTRHQRGTAPWVVCGIGVNMQSSPTYATSICNHIPDFSLSNLELLDSILENFNKLLERYSVFGFSPIRNLWISKAYKLGKQVEVAKTKGAPIEGRFIDVNLQGDMIIESNNSIFTISYGEIL